MDDNGECSSCSVIVSEVVREDLSERDMCLPVLRNLGNVEEVGPCRNVGLLLMRKWELLVLVVVLGYAKFVAIQKLHKRLRSSISCTLLQPQDKETTN